MTAAEMKSSEFKQFSLSSSTDANEAESESPDVRIQVGLLPDVLSFLVHKSVLVSNSRVFKEILEHRTKREVLKYKDFNPQAFELILRMMYDNPVATSETANLIEEVLAVASAFELGELMRRRIVTPQLLSIDNVLILLECILQRRNPPSAAAAAALNSASSSSSSSSPSRNSARCWAGDQVLDTCLIFSAFFAARIFASERFRYTTLPVLKALLDHPYHDVAEEAIFEALKRWLQTYCARNRRNLTPVECRRLVGHSLFSIRFAHMDLAFIRSTVRNSALLSDKEMNQLLAFRIKGPTQSYASLSRFGIEAKAKRGPVTDVRFLSRPLPLIRMHGKCWFSIKGLSFVAADERGNDLPDVMAVEIRNRDKSTSRPLRRIAASNKYDFEDPLFVTEFDGPYVISCSAEIDYRELVPNDDEWESIAPYLGIQETIVVNSDQNECAFLLEGMCCILYGGPNVPRDNFSNFYPWYEEER